MHTLLYLKNSPTKTKKQTKKNSLLLVLEPETYTCFCFNLNLGKKRWHATSLFLCRTVNDKLTKIRSHGRTDV